MDAIVTNSRTGLEKWLQSTPNCTVVHGQARFTAPHAMQVGDEVFEADQIFLNVGARPTIPAMPGVDGVPFLTSTGILALEELPQHLVVVGGGYVGLEFAQIFRRFGSEVTVIEKRERLASHEDEDASTAIREIFTGEGINIRVNSNCIHLEKRSDGVSVGIDCDEGAPHVEGSHVLLAVGRVPNTADLNLAAAGVKANDRGSSR